MSSLGEEAKDWIISIVVAVVLAFLIRQFIVELYIVDGPSMRPTLQSQERLVVNKFIYNLIETNSISELRTIVGGSPKTLYNKIRFADELGLLNWSSKGDYIALTKLGEQYVAAKDKFLEETLSEDQAKLLKDQVMQNPYNSCIILGIASMVECVFTLSKTSYPVPLEQLEQYFAIYSGKSLEWQTPRAKMYGAKMYSNYAIDLGLLAKNDKSVYLTPEGFKFVIQMQLHKSLKLMNYLNIN